MKELEKRVLKVERALGNGQDEITEIIIDLLQPGGLGEPPRVVGSISIPIQRQRKL